MNALSKEQQEAIKKISTTRLSLYLLHAGVSDTETDKIDWSAMIEKWAVLAAEGRDRLVEATAAAMAAPGMSEAEIALEHDSLAHAI